VLPGWEVFCQVPLKLPLSVGYSPAWIANGVLWFRLFALFKERWSQARMAGWCCVALGLSALVAARFDTHWLTVLIGYYIWLLSMFAFLLAVESLHVMAQKKGRTI
jgi:uncharacterized membrane protein